MGILISDLQEHERPRERLAAQGASALTETELLALVLRSGTTHESALELSASMLAEYGGLSQLSAARPEELAARRGIGEAKASSLVAAFQLGRIVKTYDSPPVLMGLADVARIARPHFEGHQRERVLVLVCDAANRIKRSVVVSEGAVDRSLVPIREILNAVLRNDGRAFAIAHNHPSGNMDPSEADRAATKKVAHAAGEVGLRFLGHVIVSTTSWTEVVIR